MTFTLSDVTIREPVIDDTADVYDLIGRCAPLDQNSIYCNMLQVYHFRRTSTMAIGPDGQTWGFVSGYTIPAEPRTLFIWQVAVSAKARGLGLGKEMIYDIFRRDENRDLEFLQSTITRENGASWAMFKKIARELDSPIELKLLLTKEEHFDGEQDDEILIELGPFDRNLLGESQ